MDSDMAGYRTDFKNAYAAHAEKLNIRVSVLKDEFRRANAMRKQIEKEKAYDDIERQQRETLRAATLNMQLNGAPLFEWFNGTMAAPSEGRDLDDDDAEEGRDHDDDGEPEAAGAGEVNHTGRRELAVS